MVEDLTRGAVSFAWSGRQLLRSNGDDRARGAAVAGP
jgi:hypothetical protein